MIQITKGIKSILYINLIMLIISYLAPAIIQPLMLYNFTSENFLFIQLITHQFLHGGMIHFLFNMMFLVFLGPLVEDYLGTKRFIIFYLICGIFAAVFHILINNPTYPMVGASGALFGILIMFAFLFPNMKLQIIFLPWFKFKAKFLLGAVFLIEVIATLKGGDGMVSHHAHIGGAIMGSVLLFLDKFILKNPN